MNLVCILVGGAQYMKLGIFKKIIDLIITIIKSIKIGKRAMPDGQNNTSQGGNQPVVANQRVGISANTPIIFTVKSFFATVGSFLGLLIGFYFAFIVPAINDGTEEQKELFNQHKEFMTTQFNGMKQSIDGNTKAIGVNNNAIKANNDRFRDLNQSVESLHGSGGSFGTAGTGQ